MWVDLPSRPGAPPAASAKASPDNNLLTLAQFSFVRHPRISDLHRSLNDICGFTVDDEDDIHMLFATPERVDIKGDADLLRAACCLLVEKAISPIATETPGNASAVIKPTIDNATTKVSDTKGKTLFDSLSLRSREFLTTAQFLAHKPR